MPGYYVPPWMANNPVETMERQRQALHDEGLQDAALGQRAAEAEAGRRQQAWEMQRREQMSAQALTAHQQIAAESLKQRAMNELVTEAIRQKAAENTATRDANTQAYRTADLTERGRHNLALESKAPPQAGDLTTTEKDGQTYYLHGPNWTHVPNPGRTGIGDLSASDKTNLKMLEQDRATFLKRWQTPGISDEEKMQAESQIRVTTEAINGLYKKGTGASTGTEPAVNFSPSPEAPQGWQPTTGSDWVKPTLPAASASAPPSAGTNAPAGPASGEAAPDARRVKLNRAVALREMHPDWTKQQILDQVEKDSQ